MCDQKIFVSFCFGRLFHLCVSVCCCCFFRFKLQTLYTLGLAHTIFHGFIKSQQTLDLCIIFFRKYFVFFYRSCGRNRCYSIFGKSTLSHTNTHTNHQLIFIHCFFFIQMSNALWNHCKCKRLYHKYHTHTRSRTHARTIVGVEFSVVLFCFRVKFTRNCSLGLPNFFHHNWVCDIYFLMLFLLLFICLGVRESECGCVIVWYSCGFLYVCLFACVCVCECVWE